MNAKYGAMANHRKGSGGLRRPREEARRARNELYRQHILQAAERVFSERGFENAKLQEISAQAGLSMGTIYSIFWTPNWANSSVSSCSKPSCDRSPRERSKRSR